MHRRFEKLPCHGDVAFFTNSMAVTSNVVKPWIQMRYCKKVKAGRNILVNVDAIAIIGNNLKQKWHSPSKPEAVRSSATAVTSSRWQHARAPLLLARNESLHNLYFLRRDIKVALLHHVIKHHF